MKLVICSSNLASQEELLGNIWLQTDFRVMWPWATGSWDNWGLRNIARPASTPGRDVPARKGRPSLWVPKITDPKESTCPSQNASFASRSLWTPSCRPRIEQSSSPATSPVQTQGTHVVDFELKQNIKDAFCQLQRQHKKLSHLREEEVAARTLAQIEWAKCAVARTHYSDSQTLFMSQVRDAMETGDLANRIGYLEELKQQADRDLDKMKLQTSLTKELEERLSNISLRLQDRESAFVLASQKSARLLSSSPQSIRPTDSQGASRCSEYAASPAAAAKAMHPLLEDYYDKAGDVGLIGEELADLDIEHQEATAFRIFQLDHEEQPTVSSVQFEHDYRVARAEIEQRLRIAIQEAQSRKRLCIDRGLDIDGEENDPSEGTDDLILGRNDEIKQWASRIPGPVGNIAPDDEIPELLLEDHPLISPKMSSVRTAYASGGTGLRRVAAGESYRLALMLKVAMMRDFSRELFSRGVRVRRQRQGSRAQHPEPNDWSDDAAWVYVPERKSSTSHPERRASLGDVNIENHPNKGHPHPNLRPVKSTSHLLTPDHDNALNWV